MVYRRYIRKNGKTYGPYAYHSKKKNGKVVSEYRGKHETNSNTLSIFLLAFFSLILITGYVLTDSPKYFENVKTAAVNSIGSITGFVTSEIPEISTDSSDEISPSEEETSQPETIEEPVQQEPIPESTEEPEISETITNNETEETPTEIPQTNQNQTEIVEETPNKTQTENQTIILNETSIEETLNQTNETEIDNSTNEINETIQINGSAPEEIQQNPIQNETLPKITEINISEINETIIKNETIISNGTEVPVNTVQFQAFLGQPVIWRKTLSPSEASNISVKIPKDAEKIIVKKIKNSQRQDVTSTSVITGAVIGAGENPIMNFIRNIFGAITGNAIKNPQTEKEIEVEIDDAEAEYEIEYETPAPYAIEKEKPRGKEVKIVGPEEIHYENVFSFTQLNENLNLRKISGVKIYWAEEARYIDPVSVQDTNDNGIYDYIEWITPHLSNQTFEIVITKAEHLNSNREFISDIYAKVSELDDIWTETIPSGDYIRAVFEENLTSDRDITFYPRIISGNPKIEIYEKNKNELIAEFTNIQEEEYNTIYLENLLQPQDTFDLKIVGGDLEFDHIIDPPGTITDGSSFQITAASITNGDTTTATITLTKDNKDAEAYEAVFLEDQAGAGTRVTDLCGSLDILVNSVTINQDDSGTCSVASSNGVFNDYVSCGTLNTNNVLDITYTIQGCTAGGPEIYSVDVSSSTAGKITAATDTLTVTAADSPPTWSSPSVDDSTPNPGQTGVHNVTWSDDNSLSYATLEVNSSGVNCDTLANVSATSLSGTSATASLSWAIPNACEGKTIGWRQYANDSLNQFNATDLQTYTVNNINPTASFGTNPVDNYNSSSSSVTFELKVSDNLNVNGLSLYADWTGSWLANQTNSTPVNDTLWSVTISDIPEGTHVWAAWGNDTLGNSDFTDTNRTLTVDTTIPAVTTNSPLNQSYTSASTIFNITSTDATSGINSCQYSLDGEANVSLINSAASFYTNTNSSMTQGSHTATFYCDDFAGNLNGTESVTFFIDSIVPQIAFTTGTENNATSKNQDYIFANVTLTETNFQNITYTLQNSTGIVNQTTYTSQVTSINWTGLSNENVQYQYNVSSYDQYGNSNQTETRYITLSANTAPSVTILYPTATTYNTDITELNYSATDAEANLAFCWYSLDSGATNSSPDASCANITSLTASEGSNTWTVYANDTSGLESNNAVTFTKDTTFPQFSSHLQNPSTPNEDQNFQANVTVTETNLNSVIFEFNGTANYTVTTSNGDEYYFTINSGNYTAHDSITYYWYADDTAGNLNRSAQQSFTVANQIPSVSAPAINDTTPATNDLISCDSGTFSDNDAEDSEVTRFFRWYDDNTLISGQVSQTLDLSTSGLDKGNIVLCSILVYDGFDNSSWVNSSNSATIQNSAPAISNPQTSVTWDANGSTFTYQYSASDADSDSIIWYDNTTLFDINSTGYISDTPAESEAGTYAIRISAGDGTTNTTDDFTYTINDVTSPTIDFASPTETNDSSLTRDYIQINITASDTNGIGTITINLYNSTSLVQSNTSTSSPFISNFTSLPDEVYYFNATVNDSSGNENSTSTRTVSTDTGAPSVSYVSPTESSGVYRNRNYAEISVTASDPNLDTILIRLYDSGNNLVNSNSSTSSPFISNFTGLNEDIYYYNVTANDTFGNSADLTTRNITFDTTNPAISSITESPSDPQTYSLSNTYEFNATISDTNLDTILFEFNSVNYTPTNTGGVYNVTFPSLAAGTYNYIWYANDSAGNVNATAGSYTINNATGDITLLINGSAANQSGTYGIQTNASASTSFGSVTIYRNGTDITSENNNFITLAANYYNYTATSSGDANHSSASTTLYVTLSKASSEVNLTLNITDGNVTIVQDSSIYLNATIVTGDSGATLKLYNDGTLINQGTSPISNLTTFGTVGNFNITGVYTESENYTSSFETWYVNVTETPDTTNPSVSSLTESPSDPATFSLSNIYYFNATITDNRALDDVILEFDGTNYTAQNLSANNYNVTFTNLSVGTYNYRWYVNDTSGNTNYTESGSYTINQATPSLQLTVSPSTSENYETETTATGSNCPSQLTCTLYRDNVAVTNPDTQTLSVGTYNYTYNTSGNTNYTADTNTTNLVISKATGSVFTYLNNSRANITIEQYTEIYLNGTLEVGSGNILLYNNGTLINQGTSPISNLTNFTTIGTYNITTIYGGNENYTSSFETWYVNVTELDVTKPNINLTNPVNTSYNSAQTTLNYTASDNVGLNTCWYSLDNGGTNTTITCGQNITGLNSGEGSSTWIVYANDSKGNENSSSVTFFVDSINPAIIFANPTETNDSSLARNYIQVNVTSTDTNLANITINLYNSTNHLVQSNTSTSSPHFINYTGLTDTQYSFNATSKDTLSNQNSTLTRTVSLIKPNLNITLPENKTYITSQNLQLNFTISNEDFIWYNLDSGSNTTITGNTTFNTSNGLHTLYLYANNTNGLNSTSVTFTVDTTQLQINYSNHKGQNKGSSTDFNSTSYEDLQNISDVVIENTNSGKISFNENINLTDDSDPSDNNVDLNSNINISSNRIEINSTALPNFNKSATLQLYNLTFTNPRILRDGAVCDSSICTGSAYSGGILTFNVTHFTVYSSEETPASTTPTTSTSSSSGGGGGGGSRIISESFSIDKNKIDLKIKQGESARQSIIIKNTGTKLLSFNLNADEEIGKFLILSEETFTLKQNEEKEIFIDFFTSETEPAGIHAGKINIRGGSGLEPITIIFEVRGKSSLFDIASELEKDSLAKGKKLKAKINLTDIGDLNKSVDVTLEYFIKDFSGNEIKIEEETLGVYKTLEIEREFKIPEELEFGEYLFYVKLTHLDSFATSANRFIIRESLSTTEKLKENPYLIVIIVILLLLAMGGGGAPKIREYRARRKKESSEIPDFGETFEEAKPEKTKKAVKSESDFDFNSEKSTPEKKTPAEKDNPLDAIDKAIEETENKNKSRYSESNDFDF